MTQITRKKIDFVGWLPFFIIIILISGSVYGSRMLRETTKRQQKERMEIACPSLLSIGRSSRDTLIIMKVEPLCNRYVLDNLK